MVFRIGVFRIGNSPFKNNAIGIASSVAVSALLYALIYSPLAFSVTGHKIAGVLLGMFLAAGTFLWMFFSRITTIKPQHEGILKFFGDYRKWAVTAGDVWIPPFCEPLEVNIGERMIDMRDTKVFIKDNREATLHLQLQLTVNDSFEYAQALASLGLPKEALYGDAVIEAVVSKVKEKVRFVCESFEEFEDLNKPTSKDLIRGVVNDQTLKDEITRWGILTDGPEGKRLNLFVRLVILPPSVVAAANLIEEEKRERTAEEMDVSTLIRIAKTLKEGIQVKDANGTVIETIPGIEELKGKDLLEAAQIQQKRLQAIAMRGSGRGIVVADERGGGK